jgi:transposase-like protein
MEMNLISVFEKFGSEDKCRTYLEGLRWPDGIACPRCQSPKISRIIKRNQFDCDSCRYQFSVLVGSVFSDTHLPLYKWLLATYIICESKKGISANQLKRMIGVSYKTSWYLTHRIRSAMAAAEDDLLSGVVEVDESWFGGKRKGVGSGNREHLQMVMAAVQRGGEIRFKTDRRNNKASRTALHGFIRSVVSEDADAIYTDENPSYKGIADENTRHEWVAHRQDEWVRSDVHTNSVEGVWSLLKRSIAGSYHQLSAKHLPAYLDEMSFRFNNRDNPYLFRDTVKRLLDAETLRYAELVAEA